jgi:hypothetical protein
LVSPSGSLSSIGLAEDDTKVCLRLNRDIRHTSRNLCNRETLERTLYQNVIGRFAPKTMECVSLVPEHPQNIFTPLRDGL